MSRRSSSEDDCSRAVVSVSLGRSGFTPTLARASIFTRDESRFKLSHSGEKTRRAHGVRKSVFYSKRVVSVKGVQASFPGLPPAKRSLYAGEFCAHAE